MQNFIRILSDTGSGNLMLIIIVLAIVAILGTLLSGYVKAPPDTA